MNLNNLKKKFTELFKQTDMEAFFSPGRINLIGEHTDYNGGNVFPCAITLGTYGLAAKREDKTLNFYSENFAELGIISIDLDNLEYNVADRWTNYPKGMIKFLKESGYDINQGLDILYYGNIPNGAGLSSSASIELLTGFIVQTLFGLDIDRLELIKTGQRVENEFIGVNSGIMDQFAVGKGKKDTAILLDCNTLEYELIPVVLENHSIVIMNTKKRRELADSKYNERRSECDQALTELQKFLTVSSLGALDEQTFADHQSILSNETILKRARHAVTENQRTLKAAVALKAGNLKEFGQLMNQSHISLRDDYEVTGPELDAIVQAAWDQPGILGARMTGAGFGGCAIAIVENDKIDDFIDQVGKQYLDQIGYPGEFYIAQISDGPKLLEEESV
ncbi:galactokinase [Carnobacterium viridans]|uniref:Galactokinase n=1 Tax=Carnobacterium viridans TaxID=174587 RepID=A0A1H0ZGX0_9LACT|nr:galactokinase [Carnobacterium viridans]UDE94638.1 galactokinase [Carnobacterium viridans]SDQ26673.1 galactokinase [Carnobacterium viridans]